MVKRYSVQNTTRQHYEIGAVPTHWSQESLVFLTLLSPSLLGEGHHLQQNPTLTLGLESDSQSQTGQEGKESQAEQAGEYSGSTEAAVGFCLLLSRGKADAAQAFAQLQAYRHLCTQRGTALDGAHIPSWLYLALLDAVRSLVARELKSGEEDEAPHSECPDLGDIRRASTEPAMQQQAVRHVQVKHLGFQPPRLRQESRQLIA